MIAFRRKDNNTFTEIPESASIYSPSLLSSSKIIRIQNSAKLEEVSFYGYEKKSNSAFCFFNDANLYVYNGTVTSETYDDSKWEVANLLEHLDIAYTTNYDNLDVVVEDIFVNTKGHYNVSGTDNNDYQTYNVIVIYKGQGSSNLTNYAKYVQVHTIPAGESRPTGKVMPVTILDTPDVNSNGTSSKDLPTSLALAKSKNNAVLYDRNNPGKIYYYGYDYYKICPNESADTNKANTGPWSIGEDSFFLDIGLIIIDMINLGSVLYVIVDDGTVWGYGYDSDNNELDVYDTDSSGNRLWKKYGLIDNAYAFMKDYKDDNVKHAIVETVDGTQYIIRGLSGQFIKAHTTNPFTLNATNTFAAVEGFQPINIKNNGITNQGLNDAISDIRL